MRWDVDSTMCICGELLYVRDEENTKFTAEEYKRGDGSFSSSVGSLTFQSVPIADDHRPPFPDRSPSTPCSCHESA